MREGGREGERARVWQVAVATTTSKKSITSNGNSLPTSTKGADETPVSGGGSVLEAESRLPTTKSTVAGLAFGILSTLIVLQARSASRRALHG